MLKVYPKNPTVKFVHIGFEPSPFIVNSGGTIVPEELKEKVLDYMKRFGDVVLAKDRSIPRDERLRALMLKEVMNDKMEVEEHFAKAQTEIEKLRAEVEKLKAPATITQNRR